MTKRMTDAEKKKRAKPLGKRKPAPDPKKVKVTVEQLGKLHGHIVQMLENLRDSTKASFTQQFQNIQSLAAGLDSSEFNLRAQQKVINALVMNQLEIFKLMNVMVTDLNGLITNPAEHWTEIEQEHLAITEFEVEGTEESVERLDWPFYHKQVEDDKAEIERLQEEQQKEAEEQLAEAKVEADKKDIESRVAEVRTAAIEAGNDPDEVEKAARELLEESKQVADETGKMLRGEPYDEKVIVTAQNKIEEDEKAHPSEFPPGATVFGGG